MAYFEGEVTTITYGNGGNNGNGMFGNDGWWGIVLLALVFGWGRNGYGGFGGESPKLPAQPQDYCADGRDGR